MLKPISLKPVGIAPVGNSGFSTLSLGNTSVSSPLGGKGGFNSIVNSVGGFAGNLASLSNLSSDPLGATAGLLKGIPVVGEITSALAGIGKLFGFGPDDWQTVEKNHLSKLDKDYKHAVSLYLNNQTLEEHERYTYLDMYLNSYIEYNTNRMKDFKAQNSIKGRQFLIQKTSELLTQIREKLSSKYDAQPNTEDTRKYNLRDANASITKWIVNPVTYMVYTPKKSALEQRQDAKGNDTTDPKKSNSQGMLIALALLVIFKKQIFKFLNIKL